MSQTPWSESDSQHFIDTGAVYTPSRDEIRDVILDLIPAAADEPFVAVELGVGAGWLSRAILDRFPQSRLIGFDGSPTMLAETRRHLSPFEGRFELRPFRLEDPSWRQTLTEPIRAVVSVLVVHHLDGPGKQRLYRDLYTHLDGSGAVLIGDLVAPVSEWERRHLSRAWEHVVERQSLALTGDTGAYTRFLEDQWNIYRHPDPADMPSTIPEHLAWLTEAGYIGVNVFWERAAHAVYGGYQRLGPKR
jgi:tRNA (cmo5U34)-methyltransferase